MTSPILPWICMNCTHNLLFKSGLLKLHCKAFPDGIPDEILFGKNDHIEPVIGDNGIQFDLISDVGVVKVAPNTYESVKQIDQYLNSSDTETINEYNEMMEGIQLVKLNANDCHNPSGENGGQFCSGDGGSAPTSKKKYTGKDIKFESGGDAVGDGQYDGYITANDPKTGKKMGYLDYSYYDKEYNIQMIETNPEFKRKGVATALIEEIKKLFYKI